MTTLNLNSKARFTARLKAAVPAVAVGCLLACTGRIDAAVILEGPVYVPTGANFQIIAAQGIDASTPQGKTGFSPQVNLNFEFDPSIGVSYDKGNGTLTNFGLGLYSNAANQTQSTGLNIRYNQSVLASSVTFTVEDFDIKSNATGFDSKKVEPGILIFGANNSVLASASPQDIFPALRAHAGGVDDVWDVNLGQLLSIMHLSDTSISGFLLYADATQGEKANSDPYLLLSVGNGMTVVPEPATYIGGLGLIALLLAAHTRAVIRKNRI